jgi:hypothetical protein
MIRGRPNARRRIRRDSQRMIRYRLIPALIACLALLAVAAAAGAERGSSAAVPKRVAKQIEQAKRATDRFKDVANAEAAGYVAGGECVSSRKGAMGIHYINGALLGDPRIDYRKPEILLYEPQAGGSLRLVGIEYFVLETGQPAPRILGQRFQGPMTHSGTAPSHYDLHVWAYKRNPRGLFEQYNPRVSCP